MAALHALTHRRGARGRAKVTALPTIGNSDDLGLRVVADGKRPRKVPTLNEAIDQFVDLLEVGGSKRDCLSMYRTTLRKFARFVEDKTADVVRYLKHLKSEGRKKATILQHFMNIRTLFNRMIEAGAVKWSPVACLRMKKPPVKARPWLETPQQRAVCLDAVRRTWMEGPTMVGLFAGFRAGEVRNLRWEDIDKRVLWVNNRAEGELDDVEEGWTSKNRKSRHVPMCRELLDWLADEWLSRDCPEAGWVFLNGEGNPHLAEKRTRWFNVRMKQAGLEVTFHGLRHTWISMMLQAKKSFLKVMRWAGHSALEMTERYAHLVAEYDDDVELSGVF